MSDIAIRVEGLGKQYHIGGLQQTFDRLGEQLIHSVKAPFRRAGNLLRGQATGAAELHEQFWALKDVNFEIKRGEVVGIIGRNGAGKSTLLKILSRIAEPTEGYADIYGRVGSLLEVGTGFHPELTGRENVFLNGAILGMKRDEIKRKFDEIVTFAEIEKFIDTPVKHYSSGMYVRLAFAVAAHLEPEILLIDEVLAVGDVSFQRKCLGKMEDVAGQGRTVLFVSHNMALVQTLCQRGIFLENGLVSKDDTISETIDTYLNTLEQMEIHDLSERTDRGGKGDVKLIGVDISGSNGSSNILVTGGPARFVFQVDRTVPRMDCVFVIFNQLGQSVTHFKTFISGPEDVYDPDIDKMFVCELDELLLMPGRYRVDVVIRGDAQEQDRIQGAAHFDVEEGHLRERPMRYSKRINVCMPHRWIMPANK